MSLTQQGIIYSLLCALLHNVHGPARLSRMLLMDRFAFAAVENQHTHED